ncbi:hypothetical protein D3C87_1353390 [compost metagenome]
MLAIGRFHASFNPICTIEGKSCCIDCINSGGILDPGPTFTPKNAEAANINPKPIIAQITNCNNPASAVPTILPIIN